MSLDVLQSEILKCPKCGNAWIYASEGDYGSGYEKHGYKVECHCKGSFSIVLWQKSQAEAVQLWNAHMIHSITGPTVEVRPILIDKLQGLKPGISTVDEWLSEKDKNQ